MPNSLLVHPVDHVMYTFSLDICSRNLLYGKLYLFYVSEINNIQFKKKKINYQPGSNIITVDGPNTAHRPTM